MTAKEIAFELNLGLGRVTVEWLGCDLSRQSVARKGLRKPTKHIARKLIEQDEQGERALRARLPG